MTTSLLLAAGGLTGETAPGRPVGLEAVLASVGTVFFSLVVALAAGLLVLAFLGERARTGSPSWVSVRAARLADRQGAPLWEPLPLAVLLGGLAVALVGWRAAQAGGPLAAFGMFGDLGMLGVALGLGIAVLGAVTASALAHPPARMDAVADGAIAHPLPARTRFAHRRVLPGAFGSGPVGAAVALVGGIVALVGLPVAAVVRALEGRSLGGGVLGGQAPVLVAVLAMAAGGWLLRAESRTAVAAVTGVPPRPRDLREAVGACAVLLAVSVVADLGGPTLLVGAVGAVTLVLARVRLGVGGALGVVLGYAGIRVAAAAVTGTLGAGGVVPLLAAALGAALAVEAVLVVLGDRVLPVPADERTRERSDEKDGRQAGAVSGPARP